MLVRLFVYLFVCLFVSISYSYLLLFLQVGSVCFLHTTNIKGVSVWDIPEFFFRVFLCACYLLPKTLTQQHFVFSAAPKSLPSLNILDSCGSENSDIIILVIPWSRIAGMEIIPGWEYRQTNAYLHSRSITLTIYNYKRQILPI